MLIFEDVNQAFGKTHLAISRATAAAENGRHVFYGTLFVARIRAATPQFG